MSSIAEKKAVIQRQLIENIMELSRLQQSVEAPGETCARAQFSVDMWRHFGEGLIKTGEKENVTVAIEGLQRALKSGPVAATSEEGRRDLVFICLSEAMEGIVMVDAVKTFEPGRLRTVAAPLLAHVALATNEESGEPGAVGRAYDRGVELKKKLIESGLLVRADEITKLGGPTRQALHKGQATGRYFALTVGGREQYYPAFFAERHLIDQGLFKVLDVIKDETPWQKWVFLTTKSAALGGRTPIEVLRDGGSLGKVLSAARAMVER